MDMTTFETESVPKSVIAQEVRERERERERERALLGQSKIREREGVCRTRA